MFDALMQSFGQSAQGQSAFQQLMSQGFSQQQSADILGAALPAAANAFGRAHAGASGLPSMGGGGGHGLGVLDIGGSHFATNFLGAAVSGLVRGQGVMGSAAQGLQGVVGGHVSEVVASRFGLPQRTAGLVGAVVTPMLVSFLIERFSAASAGGGGGQGPMASLSNMFGAGAPSAPQQSPAGGFAPQQPQASQGFGAMFGSSSGGSFDYSPYKGRW